MPRSDPSDAHGTRPMAQVLVIWVVCSSLVVFVAGYWERDLRLNELDVQSQRLVALITQRVGQHDAHLTALSAMSGEGDRTDLFFEVSNAIMRFYPRIVSVLRVPLNDGAAQSLAVGDASSDISDMVAEAARSSNAAPIVLADPGDPARYVMIKRSPNTDAGRYGLALVIDVAALLSENSGYWDDPKRRLRMLLPDGVTVFASSGGFEDADFRRTLESRTQPFVLETSQKLTLAALLPVGRTSALLAAVTFALMAFLFWQQQRRKLRSAERQAELSGLESRLSHAARVNALGEMASGIAHELTQPLTAILAGSQAARRLTEKGKVEDVSGVLEDVVTQTKRAAALLERLRTWTKPQSSAPGVVDLRDTIENVRALLGPQAASADVVLTIDLPERAVTVQADPIEMEQIVFNLTRNALDAVAPLAGTAQVTVTLEQDGNHAVLEVTDNGPGVPPALQDQLFTPFVTTREDGTGLGLALCQRLVERADGEIAFVDSVAGARFRVTLPLTRGIVEDAA